MRPSLPLEVDETDQNHANSFPPLFVMCGTGFCGSLTTWSSMSSDVFSAFANLDEPAGTSRFAGVSRLSVLTDRLR